MVKPDRAVTRLEAISDAVIAIVITVMVLELHPPIEANWAGLSRIWPDFISYIISFSFLAIYWVNHRYVIHRLTALTEPILWSNILLLFLLSLIPFATAYVGRTGLAPFPTSIYAALLLVCGGAFAILRGLIAARIEDPARRRAFNGFRVQVIGLATLLILAVAIVVSYVNAPTALVVIIVASLLHLFPITRRD